MYLLDTDILTDVQRSYQPAIDWFSELAEITAVLGFVVMELIQDARNKQEVELALKLVEPFRIIWPRETDCNLALENFQLYHLSQGLGLLDALIAACAVGQNAILCTFNAKHYRFIPDLQMLKPYDKPNMRT